MKGKRKMKKNITIEQIQEIQDLSETCKTISGYKTAMRELANKLGLTDREILDIDRKKNRNINK
jgi:hypothetical protein